MVAALALILAAGVSSQNLLVNPGFEIPESKVNEVPGWTYWRATWGSGESVYTTTSTKISGNRALVLTCSSSSFGVYQEVDVTPGKAYQMNGWWKGHFPAGAMSWYDCELLNGPFDIVLADSRPPDLPYKVCTYDPAAANWNWEKMSDAYHTTIPLLIEAGGSITRNGIRVASGNKLTVILKTGGFSNPYGYYDDISLTEVPLMSIAAAKTLPDTTAVMLDGNMITARFTKQVYIQSPDRTAAIRVEADVFTNPLIGRKMKVAGVIRTGPNGEHYVEASYTQTSLGETLRPLAMKVSDLSSCHCSDTLNIIGLLIRVSGSVSDIEPHAFTIKDGSGAEVRCVTPSSVSVDPSMKFASVTGISSCYVDGAQTKSQLRVRMATDITPVSP